MYSTGKQSPPYTEAERRDLLEARSLGLTWAQIAVLLGRPSGGTVAAQYARIKYGRPTRARKVWKRVNCLTCRRVFASEGAHNRMCHRCRASAGSVSPYEPDNGVADFAALASDR